MSLRLHKEVLLVEFREIRTQKAVEWRASPRKVVSSCTASGAVYWPIVFSFPNPVYTPVRMLLFSLDALLVARYDQH